MKEKKTGLKIYQSVVIFAVAVLIALVPSLLVWKYHIISVSDPAVVIGLAVCYLFAICAVGFAVRFFWKTVMQDGKTFMKGEEQWQRHLKDDYYQNQTI